MQSSLIEKTQNGKKSMGKSYAVYAYIANIAKLVFIGLFTTHMSSPPFSLHIAESLDDHSHQIRNNDVLQNMPHKPCTMSLGDNQVLCCLQKKQ